MALTVYALFTLCIVCHMKVMIATFMTNHTISSIYGTNEMQCLTQLPMEQLLKIRKQLAIFKNVSSDEIELNDRVGVFTNQYTPQQHVNTIFYESSNGRARGNDVGISAEPLIGGYNHIRYRKFGINLKLKLDRNLIAISKFINVFLLSRNKVGYQQDGGWDDNKPTKVQKIFNFSVTALAFLAFSGYLLCMIVQAIKSKGLWLFLQNAIILDI